MHHLSCNYKLLLPLILKCGSENSIFFQYITIPQRTVNVSAKLPLTFWGKKRSYAFCRIFLDILTIQVYDFKIRNRKQRIKRPTLFTVERLIIPFLTSFFNKAVGVESAGAVCNFEIVKKYFRVII